MGLRWLPAALRLALALAVLPLGATGDEDDTGGCIDEKISHRVQSGQVVYTKGFCAKRNTSSCTSPSQYTGMRNVTFSGTPCQSWKEQSPHKHNHGDVGEHNFCRITADRPFPWCYTLDAKKEWEECFLDCGAACVDETKQCSWRYNAKCNYTTAYGGAQHRTITGKLCQKWSSQTPHAHSGYSSAEDNECRAMGHPAPWCYTTDANLRWEECFAACNGTCVDETKGCAHRMTKVCMDKFESGTAKATTVSGRTCQAWNVDSPHKPSDWGNNIGPHNFCRNQDSDSAPWCYTTDEEKEWEECYPACKEEQKYHAEGPRFTFKAVPHLLLLGPRSTLDWEEARDECAGVYNGSLLHLSTADEAKELASLLFDKLQKMPTSSIFVAKNSLSRGSSGLHKTLHAFWLKDRIACPGDDDASELKNELLGKSGGPCLALDMEQYLNKPRVEGWRFAGCGPLKSRFFGKDSRKIDNIRPINGDKCILVCADHGYDMAATTGQVTYNHTGSCLCNTKAKAGIGQDVEGIMGGGGQVSESCDFQCQGNLLHSCGSRSSEEVVSMFVKVEASRTFTSPILHPDQDDALLDYCTAQGTDACDWGADLDSDQCGCGQKVADAFCKRMGFSRSDQMVGKYPADKDTLRLGEWQKLGPTSKGLAFLAISCVLDDEAGKKELSGTDFLSAVSASQLVRPLTCSQRPFTICRLDDSAKKAAAEKKQKCPWGWCEQLGNCYAVTNISSPHSQYIRESCQDTPGADLVSVHSQAEADFATKLWQSSVTKPSDKLLIGLASLKASQTGLWEWTDGSPLDFSAWAPDEPRTSSGKLTSQQSCAVLGKDGWYAQRCDSSARGICKLDLNFDKAKAIRELEPRREADYYCEEGWVRYESICFKLHKHKKHYEADMCGKDGAKAALAYVADDLTNAFLRSQLAAAELDEAWLGYVEQGRTRWHWQSEDPPYFRAVNDSAKTQLLDKARADEDSGEEDGPAVFARNVSLCFALRRDSGLWQPRVFSGLTAERTGDMCQETFLPYFCSAHPAKYPSRDAARKTQTPAYPPCQRPGYELYMGNCYGLYNHSLNWWDAEAHCRREKGVLMEVRNEDHYSFLTSSLFRLWIPKIWTGLRLNKLKYKNSTTALKEVLEWNEDGKALDYAPDTLASITDAHLSYAAMRKNVVQQHLCVSIKLSPKTTWTLEYCRDKRHFICQYPLADDSKVDPAPAQTEGDKTSTSGVTSSSSTSTSTTTSTTTTSTTTAASSSSSSSSSASTTSGSTSAGDTTTTTTKGSTTGGDGRTETTTMDPYLRDKLFGRTTTRRTTTTTSEASIAQQSPLKKAGRKSNRVAMIVGPLVALLIVVMALWYYGGRLLRRRKPHPEAKSDLADPSNPLSLNNLIQRMEAMETQPHDDPPSTSLTVDPPPSHPP